MPQLLGPVVAEGSIDDEGYREFKATYLVGADREDGPYTIMKTPGLPLTGSIWHYKREADTLCRCLPSMSVKLHQAKEGEASCFWTIERTFSSKPVDNCLKTEISNPLLQPAKISGSFVKKTKEATHHRNGKVVMSSSFEQLRGQAVTFDTSSPTVRIEVNTAYLGLSTFASMVDSVNSMYMWGLGPRCVKLSNVSWERKVLGSCGFYYTKSFEFEIDYQGFDRIVFDVGNKCLRGKWKDGKWVVESGANANNPADFIQYVDKNGATGKVFLDGHGLPLSNTAQPVWAKLEYYNQANLFALGIPSSF